MKLNVWAFAIAGAILWGLAVLLVTWWIISFEGQTGEVTMLGHVYRGYNISALGSLIGLAWALVDGFIGGLIFAWLYNLLVGCMTKSEAAAPAAPPPAPTSGEGMQP